MTFSFTQHLAARLIRSGGVIACPTEGVWGLSCDPLNGDAIDRIIELKGRAPEKGLILVASDANQLADYVAPGRLPAEMTADASAPTTWVVPAAASLPALITGGRETVAVRLCAHPLVQGLCAELGHPLISTSANPTGRPAALSAHQVRRYFPQGLDLVTGGHCLNPGKPSAIRIAGSDTRLR